MVGSTPSPSSDNNKMLNPNTHWGEPIGLSLVDFKSVIRS